MNTQAEPHLEPGDPGWSPKPGTLKGLPGH
jgi:hypothetical protein